MSGVLPERGGASTAPSRSPAWLDPLDGLDAPEQVYEALVRTVVPRLEAAAASVCALDPTGEWVEIVAHRGYRPDVLAKFRRFRADADVPLADAMRTDRVLVMPAVPELVQRYSTVTATDLDADRTAVACVPLHVGDHVIGALGLSFTRTIDVEGLVTLLAEVGARVDATLARCMSARTDDAARSLVDAARSRLAFLSAATRELSRSLDRDAVLATLTQLVVPRFADWASVLLAEGDELVAATLVHRDHLQDDPRQRAGVFRFPVGAPTVSAHVYRSGQAAMVLGIDDDVRARMEAYPELESSLSRTTARLVVPITAAGRTLGIITLGATGHTTFDDDDLTVAAELAARAGTALDNATRFASERTMVEVLQRAVLPASLPTDDAFLLAARYLPSSVTAKVGGDWYDAFWLRDGRLGLCVGDVVGHGIDAAACMGQLRNALRALALDGHPTSEVVEALNAFTLDTATTDFATLVYAVYDPTTGKLEWTSAGHPPVLCRRSSGVELLTGGHGLPIGVTRGRYGASRTQLDVGDLVLVFTDGLVEHRRETIDVGVLQLSDTLEAHRSEPPEALVDRLAEPVAQRERDDDVCVLLLRHGSPAATGAATSAG